MSHETLGSRNRPAWWSAVQLALALLILIPAGLGFGNKLREFFMLYGSHQAAKQERELLRQGELPTVPQSHFTQQEAEDGGFALVPLMNYLLVSAGFLLLFLAAMLHGMFRDIERPKREMLEQERLLDSFESGAARAAADSMALEV